jgi:hypothetical protein
MSKEKKHTEAELKAIKQAKQNKIDNKNIVKK